MEVLRSWTFYELSELLFEENVRPIHRNVRFAITLIIAIAALTSAARGAWAGPLEERVIAMFPKNVGEIAYVDLSQAKRFPWYSQFEQQVLPARFAEFAQFLKAAGIDLDTQIDGVAWAVPSAIVNPKDEIKTAADGIVCVATGRFHPDAAQNFFEAHNISAVKYLDYKMYPAGPGGSGDLFIMFVDSSTIEFGPRKGLERFISVQGGAEENLAENETLIPLINQVNGDGIFWGVLNTEGARQTIQQIVPVAGQFAQAGHIIDKIGAVIISVHGTDRMDANITAVAGSTADATMLSQLLQAGLMVRQYEATDSNPDFAQILAATSVTASGNQLNISLSLTEEQLIALVKHNSFALKM